MTVTVVDDLTPRQASGFIQRYAKQYNAGAFAAPLPRELEADPAPLWQHRDDTGRTVAIVRRQGRGARRDFRGLPITIPPGARVATHIARDLGAAVPARDLGALADYALTYPEDAELRRGLLAAGWRPVAWRVTAAAEVIEVLAHPDRRDVPIVEPLAPEDLATVTPVPVHLTSVDLYRFAAEVGDVTEWADDFPYYSDGSWGAVSLRGFWPDDPTRGVKPAEMPKSWKAERPDDLDRRCQWTTAAERTPAINRWIRGVRWWGSGVERVRLLRMAGRDGKGGKLSRHTDITDRAAGLADGQIARFHVPIVTDPAIELHTWNLDGAARSTHLAPGRCYYLDARKPHAVTNPTGVDRVHLVVDVVADSVVREFIAAAHVAGVAR